MVRQATFEDLNSVARIHMTLFKGTVTAHLGKLWNGKVVVDYYREYFNETPELFLVSENEIGEVIGFCMGYKLENNRFSINLLKHHFLSLSVSFLYMLLKGDKECWRKVLSVFRRHGNCEEKIVIHNPEVHECKDSDKVELFTIGVLPEYQGKGLAQNLIEEYFKVCTTLKRKYCLISYIVENLRAERFYYRNGCNPYLEVVNSRKICFKDLNNQ